METHLRFLLAPPCEVRLCSYLLMAGLWSVIAVREPRLVVALFHLVLSPLADEVQLPNGFL